jgi:predicted outer membrane protein
MVTKTKLALAALLMLGIASAAQAGGRDDADHSGGYRTGPLGNDFASGVNPVDHPSLARGAYASARVGHPQPRPRRAVSVEAGKKAYGQAALAPIREPANIMIQDQFYRESIGE